MHICVAFYLLDCIFDLKREEAMAGNRHAGLDEWLRSW